MKKGFTLAELMAVVVIIAILGVLGYGSYTKSLERARLNEGLSLGHTVMQARERYFFDNLEKSMSDRVAGNFSKFDIELTNGTVNGNTYTGRHFKVTYTGDHVDVTRLTGLYSIRIFQDSKAFGTNARAKDQCIGTNANGKDFCIANGYGVCSGNTCTKAY